MSTPILSQPQTITQFSLARYASLSAQIDTLKAEQTALQQQLMTALGSGATTEPGATISEPQNLRASLCLMAKRG